MLSSLSATQQIRSFCRKFYAWIIQKTKTSFTLLASATVFVVQGRHSCTYTPHRTSTRDLLRQELVWLVQKNSPLNNPHSHTADLHSTLHCRYRLPEMKTPFRYETVEHTPRTNNRILAVFVARDYDTLLNRLFTNDLFLEPIAESHVSSRISTCYDLWRLFTSTH